MVRRTCELCLKTYGKKWCETAFVIRSMFYYLSLEGCLQTGSAFARILPTGGEVFLHLQPVSFPIHHSDPLLLCMSQASLFEGFIGIYLVAFNKSFADCVWSRVFYTSAAPPYPHFTTFLWQVWATSVLAISLWNESSEMRAKLAISKCLFGEKGEFSLIYL